MVGFGKRELGFLTALPPLAVFLQILATLPIERTGLRKHQYIQCSLLARMGWLAIAAIGMLMPLPSKTAVWLILGVFVAMSCLDSFAGPAATTWLADILPRRIPARYVATRDSFARMLSLVLMVGVSLLLDWATSTGPGGKPIMTAQAQPVLLRTIFGLFFVAAALGLSMFLFNRVREVLPSIAGLPRTDVVPENLPDYIVIRNRFVLKAMRLLRFSPRSAVLQAVMRVALPAVRLVLTLADVIIGPLKNRTFRNFAIYTGVLNFGANVGGIYLWQNCVVLGFNNLAQNMIFMFGGTLAGLLTLRPLGRLIDRFGRKPVMVVCAFAAAFGIMPWAFITRSTPDLGLTTAVNWLCHMACTPFGHGNYVLLSPELPVGAVHGRRGHSRVRGHRLGGRGLGADELRLQFQRSQGQQQIRRRVFGPGKLWGRDRRDRGRIPHRMAELPPGPADHLRPLRVEQLARGVCRRRTGQNRRIAAHAAPAG